MFNIIQKRRYFFLLSAAIILPGIIAMIISTITIGSPFRLSIDFQGGSIYELTFTGPGASEENLREVFARLGDDNITIQRLTNTDETEANLERWSVRASFDTTTGTIQQIEESLEQIAPFDRTRFSSESVSATVGAEVARAAIFAVLAACVIVTGFIVVAFRQVPNAFRYGVCAIVAMFHDVLVIMGITSILGLLFGWEIDALFLTAILTTVGFSIQDTIVLFDRIRENIPKYLGEPYETIVNRSIWETIHRSLATQLNAFFIMAAILLFGGETIKQFIFILFIGLLTGTFSSIFNAVPLLVSWQKGELPFVGKTNALQTATAEA
ncbi:MAG: protein translocase subunit SecF [Anaerolineae bacterium]|jgi:preprotein translocase SecF subunit|nr:protein translocase subunit SecF [Anaerolineae bacterium]